MNTLKRVNSKVIRLSKQLSDGTRQQVEYKGSLIGDITNQYKHWF